MTRVGWLVDDCGYVGGAELTMREFVIAEPAGVEVVPCPPGEISRDVDVYVIGNCVTYTLEDLQPIASRLAIKYWNDVGYWLPTAVRTFLHQHATAVCCSPIQARYMGLPGALLIPPPVDLDRFEEAAAAANGDRAGAVSVGSWRGIGKGAQKVADWAIENGGCDVYGPGEFAPAARAGGRL